MFRAELGISLRQFLLLRLVGMGAQMPSQQLIADRLGIAISALSRHIDIARRNGWIDVEVSAKSGRQNSLALTPAGQEPLAEAQTPTTNRGRLRGCTSHRCPGHRPHTQSATPQAQCAGVEPSTTPVGTNCRPYPCPVIDRSTASLAINGRGSER